jgi:hypothetical protein
VRRGRAFLRISLNSNNPARVLTLKEGLTKNNQARNSQILRVAKAWMNSIDTSALGNTCVTYVDLNSQVVPVDNTIN